MTAFFLAVIVLVWCLEWVAAALASKRSDPSMRLVISVLIRLLGGSTLFGILWSFDLVTLSLFGQGDFSVFTQGLSWLGVQPESSWSGTIVEVLPVITIVTALAILVPIRFRIQWRQLSMGAIVSVVLLAAINAWIEELCYRVLPLSFKGVAPEFAIWVSALGFGIPHFFGYPSRLPGVLLATFLGWFLAQMTAQTGSVAGAFLIHWVQDIVIMGLLALSATPTPFKTLGTRSISSLGVVICLGLAWVGTFQWGLVLGAPWGQSAWGGAFSGVLPVSMRVASCLACGVYLGMALLFLVDAGVLQSRYSKEKIHRGVIVSTGLLCLGSVMNLLSPSLDERRLMGPVAVMLAGAALVFCWPRRAQE